MSYFGEPDIYVSTDDGKTWFLSSLNAIGKGWRIRMVDSNGIILWEGHAVETGQSCHCCDGTGRSVNLRYVQDA